MTSELFYFILGAGLNLLVALLIVRFVYYPATQDKTCLLYTSALRRNMSLNLAS